MIYLDNAATSGKKPSSVINAVGNALNKYSANAGRSGHKMSQSAALAIYTAREKFCDFFGVSGVENVAFTLNCTHSLNCVIKGVLRKGDHCIISDLEHNAVLRPINKTGISYDIAEVSLTDDEQTVKNFEKLIRPNTKMIICTGGSNVIGKLLPIEKIGMLCRRYNLLFAVDAAQTAGVVPIDIEKMNIDYLAIAPHKGLYAPMGVGVLIAEKPLFNTLIEGGTGVDSVNINQPDIMPEKLESGTMPLPAIIGASAGIDFVKRIGVEKIHNKEIKLIRRLYKQLESIEAVKLYTQIPTTASYAPVLSFNLDGLTSVETARQLNKFGIAVRAGLHCAPLAHKKLGTIDIGTVRVAPSLFNNEAEIDFLIKSIKNIKK